MSDKNELEKQCIDAIRFLAADAIEKAKSGHPGMPLGAAAAAFTLWTKHLKHNPKNPQWPDRDPFCAFRRSCLHAFIRSSASDRLRFDARRY